MVIAFEPTTDVAFVRSVFLNPAITPGMVDDSVPEPEKLDFDGLPGIFVKALYDGLVAGCFWLLRHDDAIEVHTALLPDFHGKRAVQIGRALVPWIFEHTGAARITSYAWSDSPAVAWFCRMVGMKPTRTEPWPNTRHGRAVDITYYAITPTLN